MSILPHRLSCLVSTALLLLVGSAPAAAEEPARLFTPATPAPPTPPPAPPQMLIWGGGATREEAEKALAELRATPGGWQDHYNLAEGFPRVLESRTVPGLKPGFFIVALGVCAAAPSTDVLGVMKAYTPFVYARPVTWATADKDCPDDGEGSVTARVWKKKGLELVAVLSEDEDTWEMKMFLRDKAGKVLDTVTADSAKDSAWATRPCDFNSSFLDDNGPRASFSCETYGCTIPAQVSYDTVYGIDAAAGKISSREVDRRRTGGECD